MIENNDNKNFWIYNNKIFSEQDAINYYGFVYLITNLINNKMYVGKKYFYIFRKCRKTGIKQLKYCDKWLTYFGSCELLKRDIIIYGKENFKREILYLYKSKEEVDECEINEQIKRKIHNKILNKTFFNYLENYLNLIKEGNDELKTK